MILSMAIPSIVHADCPAHERWSRLFRGDPVVLRQPWAQLQPARTEGVKNIQELKNLRTHMHDKNWEFARSLFFYICLQLLSFNIDSLGLSTLWCPALPGLVVTLNLSTGHGRLLTPSGWWQSAVTVCLSHTKGPKQSSRSRSALRMLSTTCTSWFLCWRRWL